MTKHILIYSGGGTANASNYRIQEQGEMADAYFLSSNYKDIIADKFEADGLEIDIADWEEEECNAWFSKNPSFYPTNEQIIEDASEYADGYFSTFPTREAAEESMKDEIEQERQLNAEARGDKTCPNCGTFASDGWDNYGDWYCTACGNDN